VSGTVHANRLYRKRSLPLVASSHEGIKVSGFSGAEDSYPTR
jgi:hypothetical protein